MILDGISFPNTLKPIQTRKFFKYKNISTEKAFNNLLDSLENKYFYFSRPNQLNDPFDANVPNEYEATDEEIRNWQKTHPKLLRLHVSDIRKKIENGTLINVLDKAAEKDRNNFCILSLCSSEINEILWGTYTDSYSGVCLGYNTIQFDNEEIDGEKVFYIESINKSSIEEFTPELREINQKNYFFIRPVIYDNDGLHKYNNFRRKETIKNIEYNIYHKKSIWKQENEFRAILLSNPLKPDMFNQKIYYGDNTLCEIVFGYRMCIEKREKIINLVSKKYKPGSVKYYEIRPDLNSFTLKKYSIEV